MTITEPGVYGDVSDADYHADPVEGGSLSSSGARLLLPPSCPALFKWAQDNPPEPKPHFDLGHAVHKVVLDAGMELEVIAAEDWKTKAAREARTAAHEAGRIPLLTAEHAQVQAMAASVRAHPIASVLFDPDRGGKPEQTLVWHDEHFGVWRRVRLDWLPEATDGRVIVPDLKTTISAAPVGLPKKVADFGYHCQGAYYQDALLALDIADDVPFVFVFVEKTPPYLVTVVELDADTMRIGRRKNARALELYADCKATDTWPGYSDDVELISLPPWADNAYRQGMYV